MENFNKSDETERRSNRRIEIERPDTLGTDDETIYRIERRKIVLTEIIYDLGTSPQFPHKGYTLDPSLRVLPSNTHTRRGQEQER